MPRQIRSERGATTTPTPVVESRVTWATERVRHLACPCCSLMARKEFIARGPYGTYAREQTFGGSIASPTHKLADRPAFMKWSEPEELTHEEVEMLRQNLQTALGNLSAQEAPVASKPSKPKRKKKGL